MIVVVVGVGSEVNDYLYPAVDQPLYKIYSLYIKTVSRHVYTLYTKTRIIYFINVSCNVLFNYSINDLNTYSSCSVLCSTVLRVQYIVLRDQ